jgi:hypothetical protein
VKPVIATILQPPEDGWNLATGPATLTTGEPPYLTEEANAATAVAASPEPLEIERLFRI